MMPSQLTIGVILALLLSVAGLGVYAKHQTERAVTADQTAKLNAETAEAWRLALNEQTKNQQATDKLLAESRQAQNTLRATTDRRLRKYEIAIAGDNSAYAWDLSVVPFAVAGRMCEYADRVEAVGGAMPETAGAAFTADTDPACRPSNGHLWRWAERLVEALESCNADKAGLRVWAD